MKELSGRILQRVVLAAVVLSTTTVSASDEFPESWFWGEPAQRERQDELVGKPMPEMKLEHWMNSEPLSRDDYQGKILVVDFWATWCGPCIAAIPKNNELHEKYASKGVIVLGICGSRGQEVMPQIAADEKIAYPIARDTSQETAKAWRVMWWPTYAVVDRKGIVRAVGIQTSRVEDVLKKVLESDSAR